MYEINFSQLHRLAGTDVAHQHHRTVNVKCYLKYNPMTFRIFIQILLGCTKLQFRLKPFVPPHCKKIIMILTVKDC